MSKAFSLVEILIYMGVATAMLLLSISAITVLQRSSRDSERITIGGEIDNMINRFRRDKLRYPTTETVSFLNGSFTIQGLLENIQLDGFLSPSDSTSGSSTRYSYTYLSSSEYMLCIELESGSYESFGTTDCP